MPTLKQIYFASVLICALLATARAQDINSSAQRSSLTITAAAADERVRITAPSSVVQMHVEVYAASGEKLFDQEIRGGNVFDWHLQDGQAQRLAPGNYVCVVTAKSISGKLTQRIGSVSLAEKSVSVQPAESPQLSAAQAQYIGPVEENSSWTIAGTEDPQTPTVIANDGTDGQMIRGRGALTFRIGNFFSGLDTEQMRLTEDGRLGIGTSTPQSKLDVAGSIRAERFLVVKPSNSDTDRQTKAGDSAPTTDSAGVQPLIAGTGTVNHIAKWTPDGSTLGNSGIFETVGGNVGIGTTAPGALFTVSKNTGALQAPPPLTVMQLGNVNGSAARMNLDGYAAPGQFILRRADTTAASPSALQSGDLIGRFGAWGYGATGYGPFTTANIDFSADQTWTNSAQGSRITFSTTPNGSSSFPAERMRIDNAGNVGIGTSAPASKLQIGTPTGVPSTNIITQMDSGSLYLFGGAGIAMDAETRSGGEAVYAECLQSGNNCYALEGYAPTGDYAGYMYGGKGVYAESDDASQPGVDANAYGSNSYALQAESAVYRGGYFKSDVNTLYSLYVDDVDGPTQGTAALNVRGTVKIEGNLNVAGSKSGFVVDIMQNVDNTSLEPGDVVVLTGNAPPVLGQIPVVTVKKATGAYDTAVAGVVDEVWYAPDPNTKAAYEAQESAARAAMDARNRSRAAARVSLGKTDGVEQLSTRRLKSTAPEIAMPAMTITDEQGTLHSLTGATSVGPGGYVSVVTLGAYKTVKVDASFGAIQAGDLLTTSPRAGYAMKVTDKVAAIGAIIGKALGNLDSGTGTIPVLVMPK